MEVCSNCGAFTDQLNDETGWCYECSPPICERCGGEQHPDHRYNGYHPAEISEVIVKNGRKLCRRCIKEIWLEEHANEIERYIAEGLSYRQAIEKVSSNNRAVCIICSTPIPGRHKSSTIFCTKTPDCRKAKKKYVRLIQRKGLTRDSALEKVLRERAA